MAIQMYVLIAAGVAFLALAGAAAIQTWRISNLKEELAVTQERAARLEQHLRIAVRNRQAVEKAAEEARKSAKEARDALDKLRREGRAGPSRDLAPSKRSLYDRLQRRVAPKPED